MHMPPGCPFAPRCRFKVGPCDDGVPPLIEVAPDHRSACIRHREVAGA
jgi:ABC-type dipeptide/oligopeptide/nickel transport system ATPase component